MTQMASVKIFSGLRDSENHFGKNQQQRNMFKMEIKQKCLNTVVFSVPGIRQSLCEQTEESFRLQPVRQK